MLALFFALVGSRALSADDVERLYRYDDRLFSIQFPADPSISSGTYPAVTPTGSSVPVPATIYALRQGRTDYRVTVADFSGSLADNPHVLDHAVQAVRAKGGLALDTSISHSLGAGGRQLCGREFGYQDKAGRLNYRTLFYNADARLFYDIFSSVAAKDQAEHGGDVVHFQQSLTLLPEPGAQPLPPPAFPESWQVHEDKARGFSIRFPAPPIVEEGSYRTEAGVTVPATLLWVRRGDTLYRLTAAHLWETEGDASDAVDQAALAWKKRGKLVADSSIAISNGQCGRDIALITPTGAQSRARIFFPSSQHRLYLVEVTREGPDAPGDRDEDRWFRESFAIAKPE